MNMQIANKWGVTQTKVSKCTYTWTISNIRFLQKESSEVLESPFFSLGTQDVPKWKLKLYINGINNDYKGYMSLYLYRDEGEKVEGQFTLSMLGKNKSVQRTEKCQFDYFPSCGFNDFVKVEDVMNKGGDLLNDGSLTIVCEIFCVTGSVNISSESVQKSQQRCSVEEKLSTYLGKLFLEEKYSDVKIVTPCGEELPAHKAILATRSPVFSAMFDADMMEKKSNTVEIDDVNYAVLKEMLRFLYTSKVENIEKVANELLAAADKYEIDGLKDLCGDYLSSNMSVNNVIETLVTSDRHGIVDLKKEALNFVKAHAKEVVESKGFKQLVQEELVKDLIRTITE